MTSDLVERLREYASDDHERGCQGRYYDCSCGYDDKRDPLINEAAARIERLEAFALKAFTVVEFCSGEGLLLPHPHYDCDDLLIEGVDLLKVETSVEARAALEERT